MSQTTDRPTIVERYVTADRPNDVIGAAGMAAQTHEMALMLWGVLYQGKTAQKHRLAELLGDHLNRAMARDRRLKGDAWKVAREMLAWHCDGICPACDGKGYPAIENTARLSDNACVVCNGAGKRPYEATASRVWMEAELSRMTAIAAGEVMKRLANNMAL